MGFLGALVLSPPSPTPRFRPGSLLGGGQDTRSGSSAGISSLLDPGVLRRAGEIQGAFAALGLMSTHPSVNLYQAAYVRQAALENKDVTILLPTAILRRLPRFTGYLGRILTVEMNARVR